MGLQQLVQNRFLVRGQVLDHDIGRLGTDTDQRKHLDQGFKPAGGGPDGHDGALRVDGLVLQFVGSSRAFVVHLAPRNVIC